MTSREKFEAWWEENYHNGNPPRFGWEAWRDGDGYQIDDDESELDGMWNAWQAAESASEQQLEESQREFRAADATIENLQMQVEKLAAENAGLKVANAEGCKWDGEQWVGISIKTPATDAFLAEVRAQGVEMLREHPAIKLCSLTHVCDEFAAQLRKGVQS